jgi:ElaB/YqjD/DUF883 family membrane-anchored ribosome-binding protein
MASPYSQVKDEAPDKAEGLVDKATEAARGVADQAGDLADRAIEQGREVGAMAQKAPGAMRDALDTTSLTQQPMATLAIAGALGFLLGALWRS